ncbi:MAG: hypothetical protein DKM24_01020 [Candidatus Melainabacteria bacterium]|jgi:hypothetical protein|nr:MAG: hypothetical protein DKM24_01020 [Candidatus Melainabacteria bacterium]
MFTHCHTTFRTKDVYFLFDNKDFMNRHIFIAMCPKCKQIFTKLVETRKADNKRFEKTLIGNKAEKMLNSLRNEVDIKQSDLVQKRAKMHEQKGIVYGENIEYKCGDVARYAHSFINNKRKLVGIDPQ